MTRFKSNNCHCDTLIVRHGGSSDLNFVARGMLCYTCANCWSRLVGQAPFDLSVQCLKDSIASFSSGPSVLLNTVPYQEIDTEYRREQWHSDSKEDTRLYQTYSKGIIGSVSYSQGWPWPFFVCWKFGRKDIGFGGKVQPVIVTSTLSGPLRRISFIASSRLPCRVTRLKAKPVIKA